MKRLIQNAIDRFLQIGLRVVNGKNDANLGGHLQGSGGQMGSEMGLMRL